MRFELDVVCTDSGRHKRTRLTRIKIHDERQVEQHRIALHITDAMVDEAARVLAGLRTPLVVTGRASRIHHGGQPRSLARAGRWIIRDW